MGDTDELLAAIAESDRECEMEIESWSARDPDTLHFSMGVKGWRLIRAALTQRGF